jgi:dGTPase
MDAPKTPPDGSRVRPVFSDREEAFLSPFAFKSRNAVRLYPEEDLLGFRDAFQEDYHRIVRSRSFRRLAHKTQALSALTGDHRRTRLTHTLEVSLIAKTLGRVFALNEDLTGAIAMGHDLGHAPFGHAGERALNGLFPGGFSHNEQSLRVVDLLADNGKGLNLTLETRDGIVKHSKGQGPIFPEDKESLPKTLEGLVVRVSDIIAYLAHDFDDAEEAGILKPKDIPIRILRVFGESGGSRENAILKDLITHSLNDEKKGLILSFSPEMEEDMEYLREFLFKKVYRDESLMKLMDRGAAIVRAIYLSLMENDSLYEKLPLAHLAETREEAARDFIAGMTDRFAINYAWENLGMEY